jgi:hypothetical protein
LNDGIAQLRGDRRLAESGRHVHPGDPRIFADPTMPILPRRLRWIGSIIGLTEFMSLVRAEDR